jgi:UDP-2,3-diacylglucosamine hydrolase
MSTILRGHFLSDLHLLARRSSASSMEPRIRQAASQSHTMVLGGDIFDFKWSTFSSLESSIDSAITWLEELIVSNPQCSFHYVLGNHDAHPRFVSELDRLAFRQPRLQWQPYVLRIRECVFLHGDIVDCEPNHTILAERRKRHESKPSPKRHAHWLYDLVVHARLHRAAMHVAIRPKSILRKLTQYLTEEGLDKGHGVRDVYFGHTHRMVNAVQYAGLTFHNGGASIHGLPFRIIETRLPFQQVE